MLYPLSKLNLMSGLWIKALLMLPLMNKTSKNKKIINYYFRATGFVLGMFFVIYGIYLFTHSLDDDILELLHCTVSVFMGIIFIIYGLTGRRYIR